MNSIQYDDEKSALEKMQSSLRNVVFEILYYVINQTEQFSVFIYIIFVMIESFQILFWYFTTDVIKSIYFLYLLIYSNYICFSNTIFIIYLLILIIIISLYIKIISLWIVQSVASKLSSFFSYFLIVPQLSSFSQMIAAMYAIIVIFACILLLMLYVSVKIKNGISGLSGALSIIKVLKNFVIQ